MLWNTNNKCHFLLSLKLGKLFPHQLYKAISTIRHPLHLPTFIKSIEQVRQVKIMGLFQSHCYKKNQHQCQISFKNVCCLHILCTKYLFGPTYISFVFLILSRLLPSIVLLCLILTSQDEAQRHQDPHFV